MPASGLCSLSDWVQNRTSAIYVAPNKTESKKAIAELFAPHVKASINGRSITRQEIDELLLVMRPAEEGALGFYWTDLVATPKDSSERGGAVSGMYVIAGLHLPHPQTGELVPTYRRKGVAVIIESQSQDLDVDSRKVVEFVSVANNYPLDQLAVQEKERGSFVSKYGYRL
ncbi:hypothetical protein EV361DRAFT_959987 [Lentinula raphanica]|uniref:Uncharacterized protein n=1 Tax=Lentinula raphanica TaxID=153919 RepID=A0AA38UFY6_9AGAR|nr:hypothetical protein F5880DRAFT_1697943 [Lentinula raphanica]KAJ3840074.1 hypothetical protein F5878DRAFT_675961 [Lentinula raphanica]KAJ3974788.1 hypothetical protein EV361DRAFT_959987 [Lentinula raphanica]